MFNELNDEEIAALIRVRKYLRDGTIGYLGLEYTFEYDDLQGPHQPGKESRYFHMACVVRPFHLGFVGCIGGHFLKEIHGYTPSALTHFCEGRPRFRQLAFYNEVNYDWYQVTPEQAVKAIDNYMFNEEHIWSHVIA